MEFCFIMQNCLPERAVLVSKEVQAKEHNGLIKKKNNKIIFTCFCQIKKCLCVSFLAYAFIL